jgi:hypothetical protein
MPFHCRTIAALRVLSRRPTVCCSSACFITSDRCYAFATAEDATTVSPHVAERTRGASISCHVGHTGLIGHIGQFRVAPILRPCGQSCTVLASLCPARVWLPIATDRPRM